MMLIGLISVAAAAATVCAGPCQPRSSVVSFGISVTLSDALPSTIPGSSTDMDSATVTTDVETESTVLPTTTADPTFMIVISSGTTDSSFVTETSWGTEISSASETSLVVETETMTSGSTTETSIMPEPTSTAETSTIYESTTTASGSIPVPTLSVIARSLSAESAGVEGYTLASSSSVMSYAMLMRPGSAPPNWLLAFYVDETTGRLFNTAGQAFWAFVKAFGQKNDPAELRVCESDTEETDDGFDIRVLKCALSSVGALDCSLTSSSGPYKHFIAHSDGTLRITTKSEEAGFAYVSLEIVQS